MSPPLPNPQSKHTLKELCLHINTTSQHRVKLNNNNQYLMDQFKGFKS